MQAWHLASLLISTTLKPLDTRFWTPALLCTPDHSLIVSKRVQRRAASGACAVPA